MAYRKIELLELLPADIIVTTDKESPISSTIKKLRFLLFILVLSFVLSSCSPINKWRSRTPVKISDSVEVGSDWIEIILTSPLISLSGTSQRIKIFTPLDINGNGGKDGKTIKLKDGRITRVEAFLYDEKGNEFELFISGYGSTEFSMDNTPPNAKQYVNFPDGKYTKLKIRSKTPIKVEKIEWSADYSIDELGHLP